MELSKYALGWNVYARVVSRQNDPRPRSGPYPVPGGIDHNDSSCQNPTKAVPTTAAHRKRRLLRLTQKMKNNATQWFRLEHKNTREEDGRNNKQAAMHHMSSL